MSAYRFAPVPEEHDAEAPWRPLDRALLRWTRAHGGSPLLARLAAWACFAEGEGDTALPLSGLDAGRHGAPRLDDDALTALRADALVSDGNVPAPFVLDAQDRFYLWRNAAHEAAVAAQIRARRAAAQAVAVGTEAVDALFAGNDPQAIARQRDAVAAVPGKRLFVLTGGPGTGKTTTVLRMLLMLQHAEPARAASIQVAAPTGKAAQRLLQALRAGKEPLRATLPAAWQPLLDRVPERDALTLHRLLGYDPRRNRFGRDAGHPLAADIVVVDEASMVDLGLLRVLLDAMRPEATLILVGDADQLTSVGAGSVLMDLVGALERDRAPELVRLEHSFRAARALVPINRAIRDGDAAALEHAMRDAGADVRQPPVDTPERLRAALDEWARALSELPLRPLLPPVVADASPDRRDDAARVALGALRALSRRQLLCTLREESLGALALDALVAQRLKRLWNEADDRIWYPGRAVLIARNDYAARLYNGDVGLCLADAHGQLRVWFETVDADGQPSARSFAPGSVPAHEGAFAITVHKAQGSEYDLAAVLLPHAPDHRVLSRQLLYTGLSRARRQVQLWGSVDAVRAALARPVLRATGLMEKLS